MPPKLLTPKAPASSTTMQRPRASVPLKKPTSSTKIGLISKTQNPRDQPQVLNMDTIREIGRNVKGIGKVTTVSLKAAAAKQKQEKSHRFTEAYQRNIEQQRQEIEVSELSHFTFGLFSRDEATKLGIKLTNPDDEGELSVRDNRLGPRNTASLCGTCFQNMNDCTGHYAYIDTPYYVPPSSAAMVAAILTCVCPQCGSPLVTYEQIVAEGYDGLRHLKRVNAIRDLVKKNKTGCREVYPPPMSSCRDNPEPVRIYDIPNEDNYLLHYHYDGETGRKYDLTPAQAYEILSRISPETATKIFGFTENTHPKNLVPNFVIVIPYNVRPDIKLADHTSHDYISNIYQGIIKHSVEYFKIKDENEKVTHINAILKLVYTLAKGDKSKKAGGRGGGKEASVTDRVKGKEGIFRAGEGRTANYTARAVAASGFNLRPDEAGIPLHIAKKVTIETKVTSTNRARLQALYDQGKPQDPTKPASVQSTYRQGKISHIIQINDTKNIGVKKTVSDTFMVKNPDLQLQVGDTVWRYLQDGDVVLLNRQPSLHKYSLPAFRVKIIPEDVVRLPYEVAPGFNADFDGDELNMHFPQTVEAQIEAINLAGVASNVMSVATGRPMVVMIQDSILAAYMLTYDPTLSYLKYQFNRETNKVLNEFSRFKLQVLNDDTVAPADKLERIGDERDKLDVYLTQRQTDFKILTTNYEQTKSANTDMMDPVQFNDSLSEVIDRPQLQTLRERCASYGVNWGSRKCLFSAALPVVEDNDGQLRGFTYKDSGLVIINSILISGTVTKKHVGADDANMMTELYRQFDGNTYLDFLFDFRKISNVFLRSTGFSASLYDALPEDHELLSQYISDQVQQASARVLTLSTPVQTEVERYQNELKIREILNITKTIADVNIPESFPPSNPYSIMGSAGSKGSALNIAQMSALLGQQLIYDERPAEVLPGGRVLSVYSTRDKRPETRGFIDRSYFTGLTSTQYFFLSMNGREALSNTSQQTSVTGHNQRQSVKGNEDFVTGVLGNVENANGKVVQPVYGDSGLDPEHALLVSVSGGDAANTTTYMPRRFTNIANALNALD